MDSLNLALSAAEGFVDFPPNFNSPFFTKLAMLIKRGESVFLYGPSGIGKSFYLQLLSKNTKFQKKYFNGFPVKFITFDLNSGTFTLENISSPPTGENLVLIFDHAEELANPKYFSEIKRLRSLYDQAKSRTTLIFSFDSQALKFTTLETLAPIRTAMLENVVCVSPLSPADAKIYLNQILSLYKSSLPEKKAIEIIKLSGGVPRLIKRLTKLEIDKVDPKTDLRLRTDLEAISKFLNQNPEIKMNIPLVKLVKLDQLDKDSVENISFSQSLTKQEYSLAKLLIGNTGKLCSREELIEAVWPKTPYDASEHALDQMLHRLRKKLESASPKCTLSTLRGRGCKLEVIY